MCNPLDWIMFIGYGERDKEEGGSVSGSLDRRNTALAVEGRLMPRCFVAARKGQPWLAYSVGVRSFGR